MAEGIMMMLDDLIIMLDKILAFMTMILTEALQAAVVSIIDLTLVFIVLYILYRVGKKFKFQRRFFLKKNRTLHIKYSFKSKQDVRKFKNVIANECSKHLKKVTHYTKIEYVKSCEFKERFEEDGNVLLKNVIESFCIMYVCFFVPLTFLLQLAIPLNFPYYIASILCFMILIASYDKVVENYLYRDHKRCDKIVMISMSRNHDCNRFLIIDDQKTYLQEHVALWKDAASKNLVFLIVSIIKGLEQCIPSSNNNNNQHTYFFDMMMYLNDMCKTYYVEAKEKHANEKERMTYYIFTYSLIMNLELLLIKNEMQLSSGMLNSSVIGEAYKNSDQLAACIKREMNQDSIEICSTVNVAINKFMQNNSNY